MIKRVSNTLAIDFKCRKCNGCHKNVEDYMSYMKLHEDVETVAYFSYLGGKILSMWM